MASSPGQDFSASHALHIKGQMTSSVSRSTAAATKHNDSPRPNLFAADHIPSLYHRIHNISKLLVQASDDPNSLAAPDSTPLNAAASNETVDEVIVKNAPSLGPDVTMGAMMEDEMTSGYEAALAFSMDGIDKEGDKNVKRTELALSIVRESQGLRDAFQHAQAAIDDLPGGEMDIEEQEALLKLLSDYRDNQNLVSHAFARDAKEDVTMEEDTEDS